MAERCRFCQIGTDPQQTEDHNRPYFKSSRYFAIPSVGGFVEGWSLVCPVEHTYNLREHYGTRSFSDCVRTVVERISLQYSLPVMFEHGSSHAGSLTGCGTDHAHLHLVPLGFSLRDEIMGSVRSWKGQHASDLAKLAPDQEYLFYSEDVFSDDPYGLVHILEQTTSQFFRRLIARALQREAELDYRRFPFLSLAARTQQSLRNGLRQEV
jgi:hypothetical protein